jgi:hypothetical protein
MMDRVILTEGSDFYAPVGDPIRVTIAGLRHIVEAIAAGNEAALIVGKASIVEFVPAQQNTSAASRVGAIKDFAE